MYEGREVIMSFANHLEQRSGHYEKGSGKYNNLREQSECMKRFVDDYDINKKKLVLGMKLLYYSQK